MHFPHALIQAVTWRIVCEMMRRYHTKFRLQVLETHPGGGQYDCLSIYANLFDTNERHLCDFNIASSHLHMWEPFEQARLTLAETGWPEDNCYVTPFRSSPRRTIDQIEALLGFPPAKGSLPPSSSTVFTIRLIAELLDRQALKPGMLRASCGWFDSSGMSGSFVQQRLYDYPDVANTLPPPSTDWERKAAVSMQNWFLERKDAHGSLESYVLLNLSGKLYESDPNVQPRSLWTEYQHNGRRLLPLVNVIENKLYPDR